MPIRNRKLRKPDNVSSLVALDQHHRYTLPDCHNMHLAARIGKDNRSPMLLSGAKDREQRGDRQRDPQGHKLWRTEPTCCSHPLTAVCLPPVVLILARDGDPQDKRKRDRPSCTKEHAGQTKCSDSSTRSHCRRNSARLHETASLSRPKQKQRSFAEEQRSDNDANEDSFSIRRGHSYIQRSCNSQADSSTDPHRQCEHRAPFHALHK